METALLNKPSSWQCTYKAAVAFYSNYAGSLHPPFTQIPQTIIRFRIKGNLNNFNVFQTELESCISNTNIAAYCPAEGGRGSVFCNHWGPSCFTAWENAHQPHYHSGRGKKKMQQSLLNSLSALFALSSPGTAAADTQQPG